MTFQWWSCLLYQQLGFISYASEIGQEITQVLRLLLPRAHVSLQGENVCPWTDFAGVVANNSHIVSLGTPILTPVACPASKDQLNPIIAVDRWKP